MLHLMFEGWTPKYSYHCPPVGNYRLEGSEIRDSHGKSIAICQNNAWLSRGAHYSHLRCRGPVAVAFENPLDGTSEVIGTFDQLDIMGCGIHTGKELLAQLGDDEHWQSGRTGTIWPVVTLSVCDGVCV